MSDTSITFEADDIRPQRMADGSYKVVITTGEQAKHEVAQLMAYPQGVYRITIEPIL